MNSIINLCWWVIIEVKFDLTKEDYINFNLNNLRISDVNKKRIYIQKYILSLIYLIFPFILTPISNIGFWYWMIPSGVIFIYNILSYDRRLKKRVTKLICKSENFIVRLKFI